MNASSESGLCATVILMASSFPLPATSWSDLDARGAQGANDRGHALEGEIDMFLGGRAAEAEADGGAGAIADRAERLHDVRGCLAARAAGRSGRDGEIAQRHQQRLAFNVIEAHVQVVRDRKSTRLNSSHSQISYAVFCLKKKKK